MKKNSIDRILNELSLISAMASLESASRTKKLTNSIINYLRYKNSRENQIVRLGEELRFVKEMIYVQEIRYENLLSCEVSIEKECEAIYIPHYTIMTFVENVFYHAFNNKEWDWSIKIECRENNGVTLVNIKDNGVGFCSKCYLEQKGDNYEYGSINSTYNRLLDYYKFNDILKIRSDNVNGTTVTLKFPKM